MIRSKLAHRRVLAGDGPPHAGVEVSSLELRCHQQVLGGHAGDRRAHGLLLYSSHADAWLFDQGLQASGAGAEVHGKLADKPVTR